MHAFRHLIPSVSIVAIVVLTVLPGASGAGAHPAYYRAASYSGLHANQLQGQPFTIESWLYAASPAKSGLTSTVKACLKLKGAIVDEGGDPTWTDATYDQPVKDFSTKCDMWLPAGGFIFVPPVGKSTDTTVYAVHTITVKQGTLSISFSGTYDLVKTFQTTSCSWVITGGTGVFTGMMGEGTCTADASHFPYIRHTETGIIYRLPVG
jgi:hypothetical protein